ncbi:MAG TPA: DNA repair protein RecO [Acidimicrobiales bacterium]|nr:DNA repair protein RecO [Acidimicrobiales bacterium]
MSSRLYRERGVVLRTHKLGEADRIISLVTESRGKVRAVAKGVRKTTSKFGARLEPTTHVAVQCYEGRNLDVITQAERVEVFGTIRSDLELLRDAVTMLEVIDQVSQEGRNDPGHYRMLTGALRTLDDTRSRVVAPAFFAKLLAHDGVRPVTDRCAVCGESADLVAFDLVAGGALCRTHRSGGPVSLEALGIFDDVLSGRLNQVLDRPATKAVTEFAGVATRAVEDHLERRLRSVAVF